VLDQVQVQPSEGVRLVIHLVLLLQLLPYQFVGGVVRVDLSGEGLDPVQECSPDDGSGREDADCGFNYLLGYTEASADRASRCIEAVSVGIYSIIDIHGAGAAVLNQNALAIVYLLIQKHHSVSDEVLFLDNAVELF
jgi:hypothetical protein